MFIGQEPLSILKIMPDIAKSELSTPSVQVLPDVQGLAKTNIQLISAGCSCAPRSHMDRIAAARGAIVSFRFDLV